MAVDIGLFIVHVFWVKIKGEEAPLIFYINQWFNHLKKQNRMALEYPY